MILSTKISLDDSTDNIDSWRDNYDISCCTSKTITLNGDEADRVEVTEKFIQKLKCKFNKIKIEKVDERLTTVAAHRTMNMLEINKKQKRNIVDTISAVYILEIYINKK